MKALLFIAFLLQAPAPEADAYNPELERANPYPTKGWVMDETLVCPKREDLELIIRSAERGGIYESNKTYRQLAAERGKPVCQRFMLNKSWKRRYRLSVLKMHRNVEAVTNQLRDVLVLSMKKGKRVLYFTLERIVDFGYTL